MDYGSIFISVRQRSAAFCYFNEWLGGSSGYGHIKEFEYLEDVYRFLNTSASKDFIEFCAKKEAMTFDECCDVMGISVDGLVAREPLTTIEDGQCITQKTK